MNATPRPLYPRGKIRYPLYRSLMPVWTGAENPTPRRGLNARPFIPSASCYTDYEIPAAWCSLLVSLQTITTHQKASRLLMRPEQVRGLKPCELCYYYYYHHHHHHHHHLLYAGYLYLFS